MSKEAEKVDRVGTINNALPSSSRQKEFKNFCREMYPTILQDLEQNYPKYERPTLTLQVLEIYELREKLRAWREEKLSIESLIEIESQEIRGGKKNRPSFTKLQRRHPTPRCKL